MLYIFNYEYRFNEIYNEDNSNTNDAIIFSTYNSWY